MEEMRLLFSNQQAALHKQLGHKHKPTHQPTASAKPPTRHKTELYQTVHTSVPAAQPESHSESRSNGVSGIPTESHYTHENDGAEPIAIIRTTRSEPSRAIGQLPRRLTRSAPL